jgi:hypothetical protein
MNAIGGFRSSVQLNSGLGFTMDLRRLSAHTKHSTIDTHKPALISAKQSNTYTIVLVHMLLYIYDGDRRHCCSKVCGTFGVDVLSAKSKLSV